MIKQKCHSPCNDSGNELNESLMFVCINAVDLFKFVIGLSIMGIPFTPNSFSLGKKNK